MKLKSGDVKKAEEKVRDRSRTLYLKLPTCPTDVVNTSLRILSPVRKLSAIKDDITIRNCDEEALKDGNTPPTIGPKF